MDFAKLLKSFANGDHLNSAPEGMIDEALKRTPAAAPAMQLMPSQQAATELVAGLQSDVPAQPYDERVLPGSPTNNALEPSMGVAAPAPANVMNQAVTPTANQLMGLPAQNPVMAAQAEAQAARDQPIKPQSFWKDFGAKLIQGSDAFFNGNRAPIVGWGRLKHDERVKVADEKVGRLQKEQDYNNDQQLRQAQIANAEYAPIAKEQEYKRKVMADKTRAAHYEGLLKDKTRGRDMQASQIEDLKTYRQWLMSNGDKDDAAKLKEVNARLEDYDLDRESRERIAAGNVTGRSNVADAKIQAKHDEFNAKLKQGGEAQINKEVTTTLQKYIIKEGLDINNPEDIKQIEAARKKFGEILRVRGGVTAPVSAGISVP